MKRGLCFLYDRVCEDVSAHTDTHFRYMYRQEGFVFQARWQILSTDSDKEEERELSLASLGAAPQDVWRNWTPLGAILQTLSTTSLHQSLELLDWPINMLILLWMEAGLLYELDNSGDSAAQTGSNNRIFTTTLSPNSSAGGLCEAQRSEETHPGSTGTVVTGAH
ncbi:unnamed protein product [Leuciscus chuanchicus]